MRDGAPVAGVRAEAGGPRRDRRGGRGPCRARRPGAVADGDGRAPEAARPGLMALYAFNLEIARAPWVASEPMLAEIRLRWWLDALAEIYDGVAPRRHEVVEPLAAAVRAARPAAAAVRGDDRRAPGGRRAGPLADRAAVDLYLDHTAGHLMELAARAPRRRGRRRCRWCATSPAARAPRRCSGRCRTCARAAATRCRPDVPRGGARPATGSRRSRAPAAIASGCRRRGAALLPDGRPDRVLRRAADDPAAVRPGALEVSEARARAGLLWRALSGRW